MNDVGKEEFKTDSIGEVTDVRKTWKGSLGVTPMRESRDLFMKLI